MSRDTRVWTQADLDRFHWNAIIVGENEARRIEGLKPGPSPSGIVRATP